MTEMIPTRNDALKLLHEYNQSDSLRKHAYAVEGVIRENKNSLRGQQRIE